jgi:segregation and condensation protein B
MVKRTIEAALFLSSGPMDMGELINITGASSGDIITEIEALREKYGQDSGIRLIEANQSFQLIVSPEIIPKVKQLSPYKDLSPGLIKALSIIAFKGPLRQSILVNTIGNRAYEYIPELEKRGLIIAKKEGRTKILKVTRLFADYFGQEPEKNNLERYMDDPKLAETLEQMTEDEEIDEDGPDEENGDLESDEENKN